jgi:hypothetical protein
MQPVPYPTTDSTNGPTEVSRWKAPTFKTVRQWCDGPLGEVCSRKASVVTTEVTIVRPSQLRFRERWLIFAALVIGMDMAAINWVVEARSANIGGMGGGSTLLIQRGTTCMMDRRL